MIATDWANRRSTHPNASLGVARRLCVDEPFGLDLGETVDVLDSTTIDLCLSLFPWAPFRSTKAAIKLHTLLDLRGSIPSFIDISDGKWHDVCGPYALTAIVGVRTPAVSENLPRHGVR